MAKTTTMIPKTRVTKTAKRNKNAITKKAGTAGIGEYTNKNISRRAYKLEKRALKNERAKVNQTAESIRAAGSAFAIGSTPAVTSYGSTSMVNNSTLINAGAGVAGKDNNEDAIYDSVAGKDKDKVFVPV